jgi:cytochrome c-type biogenesis protein CcmH/NrfG
LVTIDKAGLAAKKANDPQIWYILGNAYLKIKAGRDAAAMYTKALALNPVLVLVGLSWDSLGTYGRHE